MDLVTPRRWLLNSSPLWVLQRLAFYGPGGVTGGFALGAYLVQTGQVDLPAISPQLVVVTAAMWIVGIIGMLFLAYWVRRSWMEE